MLLSDEIARRLEVRHRDVFWQALRFGISGLALTALVSALYYLQVLYLAVSPAAALTVATLIASALGFLVHSQFSFRAHGSRENPARRMFRFLVTNGVGYLLNLAFVFVLIDVLRLPTWTPILGFCLVTPAVSFVLNRQWVFG